MLLQLRSCKDLQETITGPCTLFQQGALRSKAASSCAALAAPAAALSEHVLHLIQCDEVLHDHEESQPV